MEVYQVTNRGIVDVEVKWSKHRGFDDLQNMKVNKKEEEERESCRQH